MVKELLARRQRQQPVLYLASFFAACSTLLAFAATFCSAAAAYRARHGQRRRAGCDGAFLMYEAGEQLVLTRHGLYTPQRSIYAAKHSRLFPNAHISGHDREQPLPGRAPTASWPRPPPLACLLRCALPQHALPLPLALIVLEEADVAGVPHEGRDKRRACRVRRSDSQERIGSMACWPTAGGGVGQRLCWPLGARLTGYTSTRRDRSPRGHICSICECDNLVTPPMRGVHIALPLHCHPAERSRRGFVLGGLHHTDAAHPLRRRHAGWKQIEKPPEK